MAFQTHWNRFQKLILPSKTTTSEERVARLAYAWGREDATVEQRLEDEKVIAGVLNGVKNEGQTA